MSYSKIPAGKDLPNDIYVAIEIPANHAPIKYEIDKDTDCLFVDRFMATPMFYPANYGFIPNTLADDGDPLDVLVVTLSGRSRFGDPRAPGWRPAHDRRGRRRRQADRRAARQAERPVQGREGIHRPAGPAAGADQALLRELQGSREGKWVKVEGWGNADAARAEITKAVAAFQK